MMEDTNSSYVSSLFTPGLGVSPVEPGSIRSVIPAIGPDHIDIPSSPFDSIRQSQFTFADPVHYSRPPSFVSSKDPLTLDPDIFGGKAVAWGKRNGVPVTEEDTLGLVVFGRPMSREHLLETAEGRKLLEYASYNKKGIKRGFLDAITDFEWSDLPFVSLIASVGGSVRNAVTISDTFQKLQNGDPVTDDELIKARLYMVEQEYKSNGSIGSKIGDIIRSAPGFMTEFFVSGGLMAAGRTLLAAAGKDSAGWLARIGVSRMTKMATDSAAETIAGSLVKAAAKEATADAVMTTWKSLATAAGKDLRGNIVDSIATRITKNVAEDLGSAASKEMVEAVAKRRASIALERQILSNTAGGPVAKWMVSTQRSIADHASRALMDFGKFGTELSTLSPGGLGSAGAYLGDALSTFLVEAPIRGVVMSMPQQLIAKPLLGSIFGEDGRTVSAAELDLRSSAYLSGNKQLMSSANAIAFGINFLEYASESSGRGFDSLFRSIGKSLIPARKLGKTVVDGILDAADGLISRDSMLEAGSWFRSLIHKAYGTGSDMAKGLESNKSAAFRAAFRNASEEAAKSGRKFSDVTEEALQKFIVTEGKDLSVLGSSEAAELVMSKGGYTGFLKDSMRNAIERAELGVTYKRYSQYVVADRMYRLGLTPDRAVDWLRTAGYDGLVQEMMEERYSDFAKGLFGLDERTEDEKGFIKNTAQAFKNLWPGWDQLVAEAVGFSVPMGVRMAVNHIQKSAGGSRLNKLQYYADQLRNLHAGTFVETKTSSWFKEVDDRIATLEKQMREEKDKTKLSELQTSLKALSNQRSRVAESIGGAAQVMSERIRFLEAPNTQVTSESQSRLHETSTAETSARAAAIYEFLVKEAGSIGRTLDDMQTQAPGEHVPFWKRIAARVAGVTGAIVTGDLSLAQMNPASWSMVDRGFDESFVNELTALSKFYDGRARDQLIKETGSAVADVDDKRKANEKELASLTEQLSKTTDDKKKSEIATKIAAAQARSVEIDRELEQARDRQASGLGISTESIRARSDEAYNDAASRFMKNWLSSQGFKFFQHSEMRNIAIGRLMDQYGFVPGKAMKVNGKTVTTIEEFASAVSDKVDQVQDSIAEMTLRLVHNRDIGGTDGSPYVANGSTVSLLNIPVNSPLYSDALLSATLEQSGFSESFECSELTDDVPLSKVVSRGAIPMSQIESVAALSAAVSSDGDLTRDQLVLIDKLARTWGFGLSSFTPSAISRRNKEVVDLARKVSELHDRNVITYARAKTDGSGVYDDPAEGHGKEIVKVTMIKPGVYRWNVPQEDGTMKESSGTKTDAKKELTALGYVPEEPTISFGHARKFTSRSAALLIEKFSLVDRYLSASGRTNAETDVDPRFRTVPVLDPITKEPTGRKRVYTSSESDRIRQEEVTAANRWYWNALSNGKELDENSIRSNYGDKYDELAANDKKMYERVYRHRDGTDGYIVVQNKLLNRFRFTTPSMSECLERGGVLENPHRDTVAAYQGMPTFVTPVTGANTYVFVDHRNPHVSYDSAIVNYVVRNAVLAYRSLIVADNGGEDNRSKTGYGALVNRFFTRCRAECNRLIREAAEAGKESEARQMQSLYNQLFAGVKDQCVKTESLIRLISDIVVGQAERDAANGRTRLHDSSPTKKLISAVRGSKEYISMIPFTDLILGGSGFTLGVKKAKPGEPLTGLARLVNIMSGDSVFKFLREVKPTGTDTEEYYSRIQNALNQELQSRGSSADLTTPEDDVMFSQWVRDIAEAAKCDTPDKFDEFFQAVLKRAGLLAGNVDISNWKSAIAEQEVADRMRSLNIKSLKRVIAELTAENNKLKAALKEKLEKDPDGDHSAESAQIAENDAIIEAKQHELDNESGVKEGKGKPLTPDVPETKEEPADPTPATPTGTAANPKDPGAGQKRILNENGEDINEDFDDAMAEETGDTPEASVQADPQGKAKSVWTLAGDISDNLSDFESSKDNDEVLAAVQCILPLVVITEGGTPTEGTQVMDAFRRFFRSYSEADFKAVNSRLWDIVHKSGMAETELIAKFLDGNDLLGSSDVSEALNSALHDYLQKKSDEGTGTAENEKFGDKAMSVFKALSPFSRVLASVKPECGKNLQGFLSVVRSELDRQIDGLETEADKTADAELGARVTWLKQARGLISQSAEDIEGETYANRRSAHIAHVDTFTNGSAEANRLLHGLIKALAQDDGTGHPVNAELAVFFSYIASLPKGIRMGVLSIASGMTPADTVRVYHREQETEFDSVTEETRVTTEEEWSIHPKGVNSGRLTSAAIVSAFSELHAGYDDSLDRVSTAFDGIYADAIAAVKGTSGVKFSAASVDRQTLTEAWEASQKSARAMVYREFLKFKNNCSIIADILDRHLGRGNSLSTALRSQDMYRRFENDIEYSDQLARLSTLSTIFSQFSRTTPHQNDKVKQFIPYPVRDILALLLKLRTDAEASGRTVVSKSELEHVVHATFNSGNVNAGDPSTAMVTSTRTDVWTSLFNEFTSSLPKTSVMSDIVEFRTDTGDRPHVAVSMRGVIPIVQRWMEERSSDPYSFRNLAMINLRKELLDDIIRVKPSSSESERKEYVERQIELLGGEDEIIANAQRTMRWPGRRNLPIIARNTAVVYEGAEVNRACRDQFSKQAINDGRWFVPLYSGDHSSSNLIQIPVITKEMFTTSKKGGKRLINYSVAARRINDATGVTLMGNSAKRSAISSADAEQVPMAGCTFDVVTGADGVPVAVNPKFGENRIVIVANTGTAAVDGKGNPLKFTNEDMKGSMLAAGFGPEMFRKMAKNPKLRLEKLHFISHGRDLGFLKSATMVVGSDGLTDAGAFPEDSFLGVLASHMLSYYTPEELRRNSITLADYDSYKVGPALAKADQGVGVSINGEVKDLIPYVIDKLIAAGVSGDLDAAAIDNAIGKFTWVDALRGSQPDTECTVSKILGPGVMVRVVDNVYGNSDGKHPMIAFSYVDNSVMAIKAANISHTSKPEIKRNNKNYTTDAITKAVGQTLDIGEEQNFVQAEAVDTLTGYAALAGAIAIHPASVAAELAGEPRLKRELDSGASVGSQAYMDKRSDIEASRLRKALLAPLRKIDAGLVTLGSFNPVKGSDGKWHIVDHTASEMRRRCHAGSMVYSDEDAKFYGAKLNDRLRGRLRTLGLAEVNIKHSGFRYGWFLDQTRLSELFNGTDEFIAEFAGPDSDPERNALLQLEAVFSTLRKREMKGDTKYAVSLRDRIGNCFKNHHGQYIGQAARSICFEDLFTSDGTKDGRTFDRTAVSIGKNKIPITTAERGPGQKVTLKNTEPMIFLAGSTMIIPRTPSYNGSMWLQACRASFPVTETRSGEGEDAVWSVGDDALVSLDPQTLYILGCDNDGDEAAVYFLCGTKNGVAPFATGLADIGKSMDAEAGVDSALADVYSKTIDGGEVDRKGTDAKAKESRKRAWLTFKNADGETGYSLTPYAKNAVSNNLVRSLADMARLLSVPEGTEERMFIGSLSDRVDQNGHRIFDGGESGPCKAFLTDDKTLWKSFVSQECPPDSLGSNSTIGDIDTQQAVEQSAKDASDARASIVRMAEHLHVAMISGLFNDFKVTKVTKDDKKYDRPNAYRLFRGNLSHAQWVAFMRHVDGLSNMTFDDLKERICSRVGLNQQMVDVLFADLLSGASVPASDSDFIMKTDTGYTGLFAKYVRSVRDKDLVDGKWVPRVNAKTTGSLLGSSLSLDNDFSRMFMLKASSSHVEHAVYRNAVAAKLFSSRSTREEKQARLMDVLGLTTVVDADRVTNDNTHVNLGNGVWLTIDPSLDRTSTKYVIAQAFVAGFSRAGVGARFSDFMNRVCRGSSSNGMSVESGYLAWLLGAVNGRMAKIGSKKTKFDGDRSKVTVAVRRFFQFMNTSGVIAKLHDFAGAVQFVQADPGHPDALSRSERFAKAYAEVMEEGGAHIRGSFRGGTVEKMRRATAIAYSAESVRTGSSEARVTRARNVLSDIDLIESADLPDAVRLNGSLVEYARNRGNDDLADLLANLNDQIERSHNDLVPQNIRLMGDSQKHFIYIPAAAQVIAGIGGLMNSTSDVFRFSERVARASARKSRLPEEHPLDILHFRRGVEALFETVSALASTSEEGISNDAFSYLFSTEERSNGYSNAEYGRGDKGTGLTGSNTLRTVRTLFSVNTPDSFRKMQDAFLAIARGDLDNKPRTWANKGRDINPNKPEQWAAESDRRLGSTHDLSIANLDKFISEAKTFRRDKKGVDKTLADSIAVVKEILLQIAQWKNVPASEVVIHPSDLVKQILPWYTVVLDKIDGSPSYDAYSGSMVNCFPGFYSALSRQQALNDSRFRSFCEKALSGAEAGTVIVPYVDLVSAINNAPVLRRKSVKETQRRLKALGRKSSRAAAQAEVDRALAGEPGTEAVIIRKNPSSRNLFDIFRGGLAEKVTEAYNGIAGYSVAGALDGIEAERQRLIRIHKEKAEARDQAIKAKTVTSTARDVKVSEEAIRAATLREWSLDTLSNARPGNPIKTWEDFEAQYPYYRDVVDRWRVAGVAEDLLTDRDYIMYRIAQEENLLLNSPEPVPPIYPATGDWKDNRVERKTVTDPSTQKKGTGKCHSLASVYDTVIFLDFETSGLESDKHHIVQIGAVKYVKGSDGGLEAVKPEDGGELGAHIKLPDGEFMTEEAAEKTGITDEFLASNGAEISEVLPKLLSMISGRTLLVGHNVKFDAGMVTAEFARLGMRGALSKCDWLDTATVASDRFGFSTHTHEEKKNGLTRVKGDGHRLETCVKHYGLEGIVKNSHDAIDDAKADAMVTFKMDAERDDLLGYVNIVGFRPSFGAPLSSVAGITYVPQPVHETGGMAYPSDTLSRATIPEELAAPSDVPVPDHKSEPRRASTENFARRLEKTLKKFEAKGANTSVRVEGNTIIVERDVVGDMFRKRIGHDVRTVVRIELGDWTPASQHDSDGNPVAIDLNSPAVLRSMLACMSKTEPEFRKLTVERLRAVPYAVRLALAKKYCPTSVARGGAGHTGHSPMFMIDAKGMRTLCSGIRLNAATVHEKSLFHEYFHASMSMLLAMGAITEKDCKNLGKHFKPISATTDDPRTWYNEEALAYAFGEYAASMSDRANSTEKVPVNPKSSQSIFARILQALQDIVDALVGIVMPNGFSYSDEYITVETGDGEADIDTARGILFNMILSGSVVESRETSESAAVERLLESNRVAKESALGEETMKSVPPLGGAGTEDTFAKLAKRATEPKPDFTGLPVTKEWTDKSGRTIKFSAPTHTYWSVGPDGRVDYISGTSFVDMFVGEFDRYAALASMSQSARDSKYAGLTDEQILAKWEEDAKRSRDLGTRIHAVHEAILSDMTAEDPADELEGTMFPAAVAIATELKNGTTKFGKLHDIEVERIVFDPDLHIAGTIDFLARKEDGTVVIIDHKTNKDIRKAIDWASGSLNPVRGLEGVKFSEYELQLNLYRKLLVSSGEISPDDKVEMAINYIDHTGVQRFIPVRDRSDVVESMVSYGARNLDVMKSAAASAMAALKSAVRIPDMISSGEPVKSIVDAIINVSDVFAPEGDVVRAAPRMSFTDARSVADAAMSEEPSTLSPSDQFTEDLMYSLADKLPPGNGVYADDPKTVIDHVKVSRTLTTLINEGIDGLTSEQLEYLNSADRAEMSKEAMTVARNALQTLASIMGKKLPATQTRTRELMFRAVRLAYKNFMTYEFNTKKQHPINAAREHAVDRIKRRDGISFVGLTAGVLVQSGITHQDIVNDTLGQLRELLASARKSSPLAYKAIRHFIGQVTRFANNSKYSELAFEEIQAGFESPTPFEKRGTTDYKDYKPVDDSVVAGLRGRKRTLAMRNLRQYPYGNADFQKAMKVALRGLYLMAASRNYAKLSGDSIVGTNGVDITASLGKKLSLARRNFAIRNEDTRGLDGITTETWNKRAEIGDPIPAKEVAAGLGLAAEDLAALAVHEDPTSTVGFMMADPEGWLLSTLRPRFRGKSLRDISRTEHNEMAGLLSRLRDRSNWWTRFLGLDVPEGHGILALHEETADIRFENGNQVRDEETDQKRFGFHARQRRAAGLGRLRRNVTDVTLDRLDHEEIDWMLKSADAWHSGQRFIFTAIGDLTFSVKDLLDEDGNARVYSKEDFTVEKVRERFLGNDMQSRLDTVLWRLVGADDASSQLPARILYGNRESGSGFGFYDMFVGEVVSALNQVSKEFADFQRTKEEIRAYSEAEKAGKETSMSDETLERWLDGTFNEDAFFDVSSRMLDILEKAGVVINQREIRNVKSPVNEWEGSTDRSVAIRGSVVLNLSELEEYWTNHSIAHGKLVSAGRPSEMLTFQALGADAMKLYREALSFARRNRWITDGDGSLMNGFGSHVPFLAGSGAFKWKCERVGTEKKEITQRLSDAEREFAEILNTENGPATSAQWRFLYDRLSVKESDISEFRRAVWRGEYSSGQRGSISSGITITPEDAASSHRMAAIIYARIHEIAFNDKTADETTVTKLGGRASIANMIDMYDTAAASTGTLVGSGLNAEQMFRAHGVLPANTQVFHHVETVVGQLARTIQFRNTLAGFLTTSDSNGRPVAYIRPSMVRGDEQRRDMTGGDESIIPEALWEQLARWWVDANPELGLSYDENCSGRVNAARLYDAIMKSNGGVVGGRRFSALDESYMNGVKTIAQFAVLDDTDDSDHSSVRNRLNGGEAIGYAKQLFSIPRVIGGNFQSTFMQRISSWSKTLSVQCSLFFPIATRIESSTAAVGFWTMLCSNTSPKQAEKFGKALAMFDKVFGTDTGAVLNRNFVGMQDIMDMMDSDDPFLEDCRDICAALGISLSDRSVNPSEGDKSFIEADIRRISRAARGILGEEGAETVQNVLNGFLFRGSERAFTYVLNATKIATALQIAQKLSAKAHKEGRAFDITRDLKPYADYINAEIGGIDPLRYAWADPKFRKMMSIAMFSWEWTKGAWSAGGGEILEDALFGGHMTSPEFRQQMLGRWLRMYGTIMIGVPAMAQVICKALGKALGWDDDNDKWFTFDNEGKIGMSAFDITPLLRGLSTFGFVRDAKDLPLVGSLIPGYTGKDEFNSSGNRRYYMHFGKQGWEFFRWFTNPWEQAMSKLSMPVQRIIEGLAGYNPANREYDLPFSNMTLMERWMNPTTDGAAFNLLRSFIPFSANAISGYSDAGALSILGPVKMGTSRRKVINDLKDALTRWADNDRMGGGYAHGRYRGVGWKATYNKVSSILTDAKRNGIVPEEALKEAIGQTQIKYYRTIYKELPKALDEDFDEAKLRKAARSLNRLGTRLKNAYKSLESQAAHHGIKWKSAKSDFKTATRMTLRDSLLRPYSGDVFSPLAEAADAKGGKSGYLHY